MLPQKMTLETLLSKYPEAHRELHASVEAELRHQLSAEFDTKLSESKTESEKLLRENKIMKACVIAGVSSEQMSAFVNSTDSVEDVMFSLLGSTPSTPAAPTTPAPSAESGFMAKVFSKTAAAPAGANSGEASEINSQEGAKAFVAEKFKLTSRSEIAKQARRSFPELFIQ